VIPQAWSPRGEAIIEREGRSLLLWEGIPGEKAVARVEHEGQHQTYAKWRGSPEPSADRVKPSCPKFHSCGGCAWMHLSPAGQEGAHAALIRAALDKEGLTDVAIAPLVPSPDGQRNFRHVVKMGVGHSDEGHIKLGAWGRGGRHIIPVPDCEVAAPILRKVMDALAYHAIGLELHPFEPETGRGVLRVAVIRASRTTGEVLITLVAGKQVAALNDLAEAVAQQVNQVVGVWLHLNDGEGNAIFSRDGGGLVGVKPLVGKGQIEEKLNGLTYRIGPGDFFQTNPGMAEVLYARTVDRLGLAEGVPFVDLYCGVGGITLLGAQKTGWALGVEEVEGAVLRARDAASFNRVNAEFVADGVIHVLPDVAKRLQGVRPVVAVNPARRGLEDGVPDAILTLQPRRIGYISCNATTMARDLVVFKEAGYTIGAVEPFDMFPNTPHVECLTVLEGPEGEAERRGPRRKVVR
jgi:23S rRNA (uracil1939-C5)-methyltransferase